MEKIKKQLKKCIYKIETAMTLTTEQEFTDWAELFILSFAKRSLPTKYVQIKAKNDP
jgi:hypothetical protein